MTILQRWVSREPRAVRITLAISALLFLASLFFDAYTVAEVSGAVPMPAILALLTGWGSFVSPSIAWFANPVAMVAWYMITQRRYTSALVAGSVALLMAASFLFERHALVNEEGSTGAILSIGPAYWLWLASMIGTTIAAWVAIKRVPKGKEQSVAP